MKVLCVIAARGKSKRLPNKNIRRILGKPLIAYTIESALESRLCDRVVVSTDDRSIAKISKMCGAEVVMRPKAIARDSSPIDEALRHAVRYIAFEEALYPDIVLLLQANVPIRKKGEIDAVIKKLTGEKMATAVATVYQVDQRPEWSKLIDRRKGLLKPFMPPSKSYRKQDLPDLYLLDGAIIAVRVKVLMENEGKSRAHAYLGTRVYPMLHEKRYAVEIDEKQDLVLAECYLRNIKKH
jgi:CMP-N,N'-diacetyllegionaminic acid synthase